jgi:hypothetical protein
VAGIGAKPSHAFLSMLSPGREQMSLSSVTLSQSLHMLSCARVIMDSLRARNPSIMMHALCSCCSLGSLLSGMISCAEQCWRKILVESSQACLEILMVHVWKYFLVAADWYSDGHTPPACMYAKLYFVIYELESLQLLRCFLSI